MSGKSEGGAQGGVCRRSWKIRGELESERPKIGMRKGWTISTQATLLYFHRTVTGLVG